jgi:hypothetical protein
MSRNYIVKVEDGYIVAIEGRKDTHIRKSKENEKIIRDIEHLIRIRQEAGLALSDLFVKKLGLFGSIGFATHTTGAGDYEEYHPPKPKKKRK